MIPSHIWLSSKRESQHQRKKRISIQETNKYLQKNCEIFNPENYFNLTHEKKKKAHSLEHERKIFENSRNIRTRSGLIEPNFQRKSIPESIKNLMGKRVEPIHSQKCHNILQLLKSVNKLTPRKQEPKIKYKSQESKRLPFSFTVRNGEIRNKSNEIMKREMNERMGRKRAKVVYNVINPCTSPFGRVRPYSSPKSQKKYDLFSKM